MRLSWLSYERRMECFAAGALIFGALSLSHTLGYWPYGVTTNASISNVPTGSAWDLLSKVVPSLIFLGVMALYFFARRSPTVVPSISQEPPPTSPVTDSLIVNAQSVFYSLPTAQKAALKAVYTQPGLSFGDVVARMEAMGFAEPKQIAQALFRTNLVHRTDGGHMYPGPNPVVIAEIERLFGHSSAARNATSRTGPKVTLIDSVLENNRVGIGYRHPDTEISLKGSSVKENRDGGIVDISK